MSTAITLRDANQHFAQLVRQVEGGADFVVTRRGKPVARILPVESAERRLTAEQEAALERSLKRARAGWSGDGGPFDRAALHER